MAKKPAKKTKPSSVKPKKAAKAIKAPIGVGAVLKKAAKQVAKKVGVDLGKKAPKDKKEAKASKPLIVAKKAVVAASAPLTKGKKTNAPSVEKNKKIPAAPPVVVKGKGKKEVVLELPAPKGVALLGKEGKKKSKNASSESSVSSKKRCREPGCELEFSLSHYCRLHYIKNWRKIKRKEAIIASGQLNNYVEELVNKYPDKYLEVIRQDLASEKDWVKVVVDLELESSEDESGSDDELDAVPEGVRGGGGGAGRGEFEDEGESF
jgi:hypothetical protein